MFFSFLIPGFTAYSRWLSNTYSYLFIQKNSHRGVAGGVVSQKAFQAHFHLVEEDGTTNQSRVDNVSGNVVSVLQAGAFFGALGSAPISGMF